VGVGQAGKAAGALHLDAVGVDLHPDVITGQAVGAVDHRVDHALEPGVLGDHRHRLEATAGAEGAPLRGQFVDCLGGPLHHARDRTLDLQVGGVFQAETRAGAALGSQESEHPNVCLREQLLRVLPEQQVPGVGDLPVQGQQAARREHLPRFRRQTDVAAVLPDEPRVKVRVVGARGEPVVLALPAVALPWNATPTDLHAWAQPPPPG